MGRKKIIYRFFAGAICLAMAALFNSCGGFRAATGGQNSLASILTQTGFQCSAGATPVIATVKRLTVAQYENMVYALISAGLGSTDASAFSSFFSSAESGILFPKEGSYDRGNAMVYDTEDQSLSSTLVQGEYQLSYDSAQWLVANSTRLTNFVQHYANYAAQGACAGTVTNTGVTQPCYDAFIKGFGLHALRRPIRASDLTIDASSGDPSAGNDLAYYESVYTGANGGFDSLITVMMASPDAAFLTEFGGTASQSGANGETQVTLSNYEIASKLAFYYTNGPPDDALLNAAASGFMGAGNSVAEQEQRLFASAGARQRFQDFYTQWIRPDAIPPLTVSNNAPTSSQSALDTLRSNAIQELVDLTMYYTFGDTNGKAADIITSDISFAKTNDIASIYNVPVWPGPNADGSYNPNTLVRFPASAPRAGLFTRAAYAFSGARDNNLIIRGSRIWKDYFCQDLTPPAAFTLNAAVKVIGAPTMRNIVIANTEMPGSACASCHTPIINPLGFPLENYDAFGRYRTQEPIYNASGAVAYTVPVDANSQPMLPNTGTVNVSDPVTFSQIVGNSPAFNACFVRHYFRYTEERGENDQADGCQMAQMYQALTGSGQTGPSGIQAMVSSDASSAFFKTRYINP